MKVVVFNDTRVDWTLHSGSERGANGENRIPKHSGVTFVGPDGDEVFVKVWGKVVMVRFYKTSGVMSFTAPPRSRRARMPSDAMRMNIEASANLYGTVRDIRRGI